MDYWWSVEFRILNKALKIKSLKTVRQNISGHTTAVHMYVWPLLLHLIPLPEHGECRYVAVSRLLRTPHQRDFPYLGKSVFFPDPAVYFLSMKDRLRSHQTFTVIFRLTLHFLKDETNISII